MREVTVYLLNTIVTTTNSGVCQFAFGRGQADADEPVCGVDHRQLHHSSHARFQHRDFPVEANLGDELERNVVNLELAQRRVVVRLDQVVLAPLNVNSFVNKY